MSSAAHRSQMTTPTASAAELFDQSIAYIDGGYMPVVDAKISVLDFGFTHSDVTYDVVSVWNGRFFQLEAHLDRFFESMRKLRLDPGMSRDEMRSILTECVRRTGFRNAYIGMVCTRGVPPRGSRDMRDCKNQFLAYCLPYIYIFKPDQREKGIKAIISSFMRIPSAAVDQTIKNYHWLDMVRSQWEAYDKGADTAFLLDLDGNVTEGPGYNVFVVRDGQLLTARKNVLEGITRKSVLQIAAEEGITTIETDIKPADLYASDEVFVASTGGGVMPVTNVDGHIFSNGAPGPVTLRMRDLYWQRHDVDWNATPIDY
jgi:branched-chain amino acid aminotransferase